MASLFAIFFQDLPQLPNYRALYKQKYFTKALARLIPWFEESSAQQKSVLLIALAGLLQGLPAAVMMQSASKVVRHITCITATRLINHITNAVTID